MSPCLACGVMTSDPTLTCSPECWQQYYCKEPQTPEPDPEFNLENIMSEV